MRGERHDVLGVRRSVRNNGPEADVALSLGSERCSLLVLFPGDWNVRLASRQMVLEWPRGLGERWMDHGWCTVPRCLARIMIQHGDGRSMNQNRLRQRECVFSGVQPTVSLLRKTVERVRV